MSENWDEQVIKVLGVGLPVIVAGTVAGLGAWMFEETTIYFVRKYRWVLPVGAALSGAALASWGMYKFGSVTGALGRVSK